MRLSHLLLPLSATLLIGACSTGPVNNTADTGGAPAFSSGGTEQLGSGGADSVGGAATDAGGTATDAGGSTVQAGGSTGLETGGAPPLGSGGAEGVSGGSGGETNAGGTIGTGGDEPMGPGSYALPPPSQCHNEDDYQGEGCIPGDASTLCGGKCSVINACLEDEGSKPGADVTFICPRTMLFSEQMLKAAEDDGNSNFNYAIVGHDSDRGGIDGDAESTCCQCYQLVFAHPSPTNERQVLSDPDNPNPPISAIPLPKPLIVQSFNTAATAHSFDVYMAAGGFGANNACAPGQQPQSRSGQYLYTSYPTDGQPSSGGVKPVTHYSECKTPYQWVTTESLSSTACQDRVENACNLIESDVSGLTEQARNSCIQGNKADSYYHMNWSVYAMKVECPAHLTEVTGCKLSPQGLPPVDKNALTPEQAAANSAFFDKTSSGDAKYETTTMEDCCRPSCASKDWISGRGLATDPEYNAFYSCDAEGVPLTE